MGASGNRERRQVRRQHGYCSSIIPPLPIVCPSSCVDRPARKEYHSEDIAVFDRDAVRRALHRTAKHGRAQMSGIFSGPHGHHVHHLELVLLVSWCRREAAEGYDCLVVHHLFSSCTRTPSSDNLPRTRMALLRSLFLYQTEL